MPPAEKKRLYLVDGMSHIYRAYYAIRGLSASSGLPTNAIYGFTNILRKLIADEKPDYLAVIFDAAGPTFRHEAYESYKATRTGMPDDLAQQLPYIDRVCEVLRVPTNRTPGYEADDVIGTLARQAEKMGVHTVIVTNDKDLCQLVNDHVHVLRTDRNGGLTLMDSKAVEDKLGVRPDQVVDLLGLWGDTSDNIPGAPGVGEKGARQIIQQFGTIENALVHAEEIGRKTYRESLKNNADLIRQSKELATIKCDVPVELDLESFLYQGPDAESAHRLFSELEFTQLTREFADAAAGAVRRTAAPKAEAQVRVDTDYRRVSSVPELEALLEKLWGSERVAVAAAERDGGLYGLGFSLAQGSAALVDFEGFPNGKEAFARLTEFLENGLISKCAFDWKGLLTSLESHSRRETDRGRSGVEFKPSIRVEGADDDFLLAAYLLDPNRASHRFPDVVREHLGVEIAETAGLFDSDDSRCLQTADLTYRLREPMIDRLEEMGLERVYREIELPLVELLFEMEQVGVLIDTRALEEAGREMEKELSRLTDEIFAQAGGPFNINSTVQLGEVFERMNFEVGRKTKTGRISTSNDVLEELAAKYEMPRLVIEYREVAKLKNTYCDALPKLINRRTGRVHTTLNQTVAATGRLSSTNPNLQNIPIRSGMGRRIRAAFVPSPGHLLMSADYSQIELRIFAHITGDPVMTEAFNKGEDIHAQTARAVFGAKTREQEAEMRRLSKIVNFAIAYAVGPFGLAQRTTLSRGEAKKVIENYYRTYTGVRRYMDETPEEVRKTGLVRTLFGRIRPIPDINNRNHALRARAEREAINAPIQGTAADLVKIAMLRVNDRLRREELGARMIMQVHDELLLEVPESEAERTTTVVRSEMESAHKLAVPLVVDIGLGKNWMEAKP